MTDSSIDQSDFVEDFAKQLDKICATTGALNTNDDEEIHFGYEQLPEDDNEYSVRAATADSDSEGDEIDHHEYADAFNVEDGGIHCSSYISMKDEAMSDNNTVCNDDDHSEATLPDVTPLMISLDPKESIPEETSTLIMDIMKKCQLPEHAVPGWAKSIPESSWMPKMNK